MILTLLSVALASPAPPPHSNFLYPYRYRELVLLLDPAGRFMDGVTIASSFGDEQLAQDWLARELYEAVFALHDPTEYDFMVVLTSDHFGSGGSFYTPLSNDIEGIGAPPLSNGDGPDADPKGALQGVVFLNAARVWLENEAAARYVFGNTLGQRWCGQAHVSLAGLPADALQSGHGSWSYWLNTSNSPCGGNQWVSTGGDTMGVYGTAASAYTDLDLYTMGLVAADEVAPLELMVVDSDEQLRVDRDAGAMPEYLSVVGLDIEETITVSAAISQVTVNDVIAAEGPRVPSAADSQKDFRALFVYLSMEGDPVDAETLDPVDQLREDLAAGWEADVRELATLGTTLGTSLAEEVPFIEPEDTGLDTADTADTGGGADTADTGTTPTDDTATTSTTDEPEDTGAAPEGAPTVLAESSCSCDATSARGAAPWWLLLLFAPLYRRRALTPAILTTNQPSERS